MKEKEYTSAIFNPISGSAFKMSASVYWEGLDEDDTNDMVDKFNFELSLLGYVNTFKHLPAIGFELDNPHCDSGIIEVIRYDGVNNHISAYLKFD